MAYNRYFLTLSLWLFFVSLPAAHSTVVADPCGFAAGIEADDQSEHSITLSNDGDQDVSFRIKVRVQDLEEGNRRDGPRRDDPTELRVLLLKNAGDNGYGWGDNNTWLEVFRNQNQQPAQRNIQDVPNIDLNQYDLVVTGEDQSAEFYQSFTQNRAILEEYVDGGGLLAIFAGSNSAQNFAMFTDDGDIQVSNTAHQDWGNVNPIFLNEDGNGLIEGIE